MWLNDFAADIEAVEHSVKHTQCPACHSRTSISDRILRPCLFV